MKKFCALLATAFMAAMMFVGLAQPASALTPDQPCSANSLVNSFGNRPNYEYGRNGFCLNARLDGVQHTFLFQSDGNLVFYKGGVAKWQSGTANRGNTFALQSDGNAVVYNSSGQAIWQAASFSSYTTQRLISINYNQNNVAANNVIITARTPSTTVLWASSS